MISDHTHVCFSRSPSTSSSISEGNGKGNGEVVKFTYLVWNLLRILLGLAKPCDRSQILMEGAHELGQGEIRNPKVGHGWRGGRLEKWDIEAEEWSG